MIANISLIEWNRDKIMDLKFNQTISNCKIALLAKSEVKMIARMSTLSFPLIFNNILNPVTTSRTMSPLHNNYKKNKWWSKKMLFFIKNRANCTTKCVKIVKWATISWVQNRKTTFLAGKAYNIEKLMNIKVVKELQKFQVKNFKIKEFIIFSKFQRKNKLFFVTNSMMLCSNKRKSSHNNKKVRNKKIK